MVIVAGCSSGMGSNDPLSPSDKYPNNNPTHQLWGLWQFAAYPDEGRLDVVPLREGMMHLNALQFLEPPLLVNLTLESLKFNGNIIDADIGLRHPFLGLNEFTGFDVCGVLITSGSSSGYHDPGLVRADDGDTRLLNPDGLTRWWNPAEFPVNNGTMFAYKDGLLGTPDSVGNYNSTINAYKFFCNELTDPNSPVSVMSPTSRCVFSAGQKNVRHYTIDMGAGLVFNYAVDASWQFPQGSPPWKVPDDFGPNANRPEAWNASITELKNTLYNDGTESGGELTLLMDIWDHYNKDLNTVWVDSPGNFDFIEVDAPVGGGDGYNTYQVEISGATPAVGHVDIIIGVESENVGYQDLLPGKPVTAYFLHTAQVFSELPIHLTQPNGGEEWTVASKKHITWVAPNSVTDVKLEYSKDNFGSDLHTIIDSTPNDGDYEWTVANDPSDTVRVRVSVVGNPAIYDDSDNIFSIIDIVCGNGVHTYTGQYFINGSSSWNYCQRDDFTILEAGAHAGECVLKSYRGSDTNNYTGYFIRFDPDVADNVVGTAYFSLPGKLTSDSQTNYVSMSPQLDQNPVNAHLGVVNGRMFDTVQIVDENGVHLEDVVVTDPSTPSGRVLTIPGMDFDADGDLWLTANVNGQSDTLPDLAPKWQLRHYELQTSSPYYIEKTADRIDITEDLVNPAAGSYSHLRYISDIAISYTEDYLFIFAGSIQSINRSLFVKYDIGVSPPTKITGIDLIPKAISFCSTPSFIMSMNDIEFDHRDPIYEKCRLIVMYQVYNGTANDVHLMKLDTDFNILADNIVQTVSGAWQSPFALAINTDPVTRNFIAIDMDLSGPLNDFFYYTMPSSDW